MDASDDMLLLLGAERQWLRACSETGACFARATRSAPRRAGCVRSPVRRGWLPALCCIVVERGQRKLEKRPSWEAGGVIIALLLAATRVMFTEFGGGKRRVPPPLKAEQCPRAAARATAPRRVTCHSKGSTAIERGRLSVPPTTTPHYWRRPRPVAPRQRSASRPSPINWPQPKPPVAFVVRGIQSAKVRRLPGRTRQMARRGVRARARQNQPGPGWCGGPMMSTKMRTQPPPLSPPAVSQINGGAIESSRGPQGPLDAQALIARGGSTPEGTKKSLTMEKRGRARSSAGFRSLLLNHLLLPAAGWSMSKPARRGSTFNAPTILESIERHFADGHPETRPVRMLPNAKTRHPSRCEIRRSCHFQESEG